MYDGAVVVVPPLDPVDSLVLRSHRVTQQIVLLVQPAHSFELVHAWTEDKKPNKPQKAVRLENYIMLPWYYEQIPDALCTICI